MVAKAGTITVEDPSIGGDVGTTLFTYFANLETPLDRTATSFTGPDSTDDVKILFTGTGFTYDSQGNITGGLITQIEIESAADNSLLIDGHFLPGVSAAALRAGANQFHDTTYTNSSKLDAIFSTYAITFNGNDGADTWSGTPGNDTLNGGSGDDTLSGNGGNDTIEGRAGNDHLDGGAGIDTVSYAHSGSLVAVDLTLQATVDINGNFIGGTAQTGGDAAGDFLANFENIVGSDNNDILTGDGKVNVISGGDSDDTIRGGAGNDTLDGGNGADDAVDYSYLGANQKLTVTLGEAGVVTKTSGVSSDIDSIKNFEDVFGGAGNDVIIGNAGNNNLHGGDGDDRLEGGAGADGISGDGGVNTASYAHSATGVFVDLTLQGGNVAAQAATHDFGAGSVANGDAAGDTLDGITNLTGSAHNDVLSGFSNTDILSVIDGGAGDDVILAGVDTGIFLGGAGNDTISFANDTDAVEVDLSGQGIANAARTAVTGGTDGHGAIVLSHNNYSAAEFENVTGSNQDDIITGDSKNNVIEGGVGDDTLSGGGGTDLVSYAHSTAVYIDLSQQNGNAQAATQDFNDGNGSVANGDAAGDILSGFEGVIGSAGDDQLFAGTDTSSSVAVTFFGGDGNDYLQGARGKDVMNGGAGDDEIFVGVAHPVSSVGSGGDKIDGGDGEDIVEFNTGQELAGVTITLGANGTLTGFKASGGDAQGDTIVNVEDIGGSALNDVLTGNNLDNHLDGGDLGNDVLSGGAGNDTLEGNEGDDRLIGGAGNDVLDGGNSTDTADYSASAAAVTVDLGSQGDYLNSGDPASGRDPGNTGTAGVGGDADGDTYYSIEKVVGSKFGDTLTASATGSTLDGGAGDDSLNAGAGADDLIGGLGSDTVSYALSADGVSIDLSHQWTVDKTGNLVGGSVAHGGDAEGDRLSGIENVLGGGGNSVLIGDANANGLGGGSGNDRLDGRGGNDSLFGGSGDDTFVYDGQGKDTVADFTKGHDHIEITFAPAGVSSILDFASHAHQVGSDTVIDFGGGKTLTLLGFDSTATPLDFNDFVWNPPINGGAGNDALDGNHFGQGALPNMINGMAGNDTIEGLAGGDTLIGGAGTDTLSYAHSLDTVSVTLVAGQAAQTSGGDADGDVATLFENITGSDHDDILTGDTGANVIDGGAGNDEISGGAGNDTLIGGLGNDDIDGGAGINTADYSYYFGGQGFAFTISLDASGDATTSGNSNDVDTLTGIQNLTGGGENDDFTGNSGVNVLKGGTGDDHLNGGGGKDVLDGGIGSDTADFTGVTAGLTIALKESGALTTVTGGGTSAGTQLIGIESLTGGDGNDTLTGNSSFNQIRGGAGDDTIVATAGGDIYDGDLFSANISSNDTLTFASFKTDVHVDLTGMFNNGSTVINSVTTQFSITHIENLIGGSGDDTFIGTGNHESISGGAGDDIIKGNGGLDRLDGGAGIDTIDYSYLTDGSGISVTLGDGAATTQTAPVNGIGVVQPDIISNFENIIGGVGSDVLVGNKLANVIEGGLGNDIIDGAAGNDTIEGGSGNDTLVGGLGVDTVSYANSANGVVIDLSLQGNSDASGHALTTGMDAATPQAAGGDGAGDLLYGFENIIASNQGDHLTGDAHNNVITGGDGFDTLTGGAGNDTLLGGDGNDTFIAGGAGGVGADIMNGGTGDDDKVDYSGETVGFTVALGLDGAAAKVTGGAGSNAKGDTLINIDHVIGGAGNDTITGGNVARGEILEGGGGDDTLKGSAGSSTLDGGAGNDKIFAGLGDQENYSGGADTDTLTFETFTTGVSVTIGQNFVTGSATGIGHLTVADDFEILIGGKGNDVLAGGAHAININGGAGDDMLTGTANPGDVLNGGLGNDIIEGGAGADTLTGGGGIDTLSYLNAAGNVGVTLHTGAAATTSSSDAQGDIATGFVNLIGGNGNDTLDGSLDTSANIIDGGASGNDTLIGGAGDTVSYAHAGMGVTVTLNLAGEATVGGAASGDHITGFQSIIGSVNNDTLIGGAGNDTIFGGDGDDILSGASGTNVVNGGDGTDVGSYQSATVALTVMLATGSAVHGTATDTLQSVEFILGSINNDIYNAAGFSGASKNAGSVDIGDEDGSFNAFRGGAGDDSITGNGNTRIRYDDATAGVIVNLDTVAHSFTDGAGSDVLAQQAHGIGGDNGVGTDTFHGVIAQVEGSNFADILIGSNGADLFFGMKGNDQIYGGDGIDVAGYSVGNTLSDVHGIAVDLAAGTVAGLDAMATTAVGADTLHSIEEIIGTNADDTYDATGFTSDTNGTPSANAGSGSDFNQFEGYDGNDTITGNGNTRVSYQHATAEVTVTLQHDGAGFAGNLLGSDAAKVGDDTFTGGVNAVRGSDFNDQITGNGEDDTLDGWLGNDTLTGGAGNDTFVYSIGTSGNGRGGGADVVTNFELGTDHLDLSGVTTITTFTALAKLMKDVGSDVVIDFHNGNTLTIDGVHKADLAAHQGDILLH